MRSAGYAIKSLRERGEASHEPNQQQSYAFHTYLRATLENRK
jgi:hypothetical protein